MDFKSYCLVTTCTVREIDDAMRSLNLMIPDDCMHLWNYQEVKKSIIDFIRNHVITLSTPIEQMIFYVRCKIYFAESISIGIAECRHNNEFTEIYRKNLQ